jgi:hypothetical protein
MKPTAVYLGILDGQDDMELKRIQLKVTGKINLDFGYNKKTNEVIFMRQIFFRECQDAAKEEGYKIIPGQVLYDAEKQIMTFPIRKLW